MQFSTLLLITILIITFDNSVFWFHAVPFPRILLASSFPRNLVYISQGSAQTPSTGQYVQLRYKYLLVNEQKAWMKQVFPKYSPSCVFIPTDQEPEPYLSLLLYTIVDNSMGSGVWLCFWVQILALPIK